ncbi:MAG TPA: DUF4981 domain-containing protein, partial [Tessaracoccus flavescens]|nr:DUF4981 domain-containing protein [Tessaracoccus flavescens]
MNFDVTRIAQPTYFAENRMAPHSDHRWFASAEEARLGESSFEQCLDGLWKFHYAKNLAAALDGFYGLDADVDGWDDIPVPAHIQLQGYDRPQYVNTQYPWDGLEDIEPNQIPTIDNPVASYVKHFTLDTPLADGERLSVSFKGAESAVAVWLNGTYIGYGCDTFTPSEFDLTDAVVDGENKLAAQVFKFSGASWLEDQDFFRFSGLFRDVILYRRPAVHVQDLRVTTEVADDLGSAVVTLDLAADGDGTVSARIDGVGEFSGDGALSLTVDQPRLWSGEDPYLYTVEIEVRDGSGTVTEVVHQRVGIRRFGIEDGVLKLNGQRIVFNGVNRHEFGPRGRVMTREETEADLRLIRANNINAVRTSHYPNNSFFYELCDEFGIYVIDEMNLETHGLLDQVNLGMRAIEDAVPGDDPQWRDALLDRAANMLERDKNHACILIWSCGNESFGGTVIRDVADYFRSKDSRPVHYEGVHWDPRYPETTDIRSEMYTFAADVEKALETDRDKPYILCEYAHAMGNSFGAVDRYVELAYRDELYQGGFIWDFADQAIAVRDRHGREFSGYGGDFGDRPHDSDFSGNGILYADHTPKPFMQEVKKLYQGLKIDVAGAVITVANRYLFTDAAAFTATATLRREGRTLASAPLELVVAPGEEAVTVAAPFDRPTTPGEYTVDVSVRLAAATRWAEAGQEVAWGQGVLTVDGATPATAAPAAPTLIEGTHNIGVRGRHFTALFSRPLGGMVSYAYGSAGGPRELLESVPMPAF